MSKLHLSAVIVGLLLGYFYLDIISQGVYLFFGPQLMTPLLSFGNWVNLLALFLFIIVPHVLAVFIFSRIALNSMKKTDPFKLSIVYFGISETIGTLLRQRIENPDIDFKMILMQLFVVFFFGSIFSIIIASYFGNKRKKKLSKNSEIIDEK